jgi:AbrB family looped-hinge helix DNA binding protein
MKSVLSEKGQLTIPKPLRHRLGLKPGQLLEFREERGKLVVVKVANRSPVDRVWGVLATKKSSDAIMRELRGSDGRER